MKIICVDNFDIEIVSDKLVCGNVSEYYGKIIVDSLNKKLPGNDSSDFYMLVSNDYELHKWEP